MKVTPKLLRELARHLEREGDNFGVSFPCAETVFNWMTEFFADMLEDEERKMRCASWRPDK